MRKKIVAGNWKMNKTLPEGAELISAIIRLLKEIHTSAEIIIAPPFINLESSSRLIAGSPLQLAAQNCSSEPAGALTGEISASMISAAGAKYVIIGHSERRIKFHEKNELLLKKMQLALSSGLIPIYCIGETLEEREKGNHFDAVRQQLEGAALMLDKKDMDKIILAYEPVWAIGTGKTASPVQAQEMHAFIRSFISGRMGKVLSENMRILYGGSCTPQNAGELFFQPDVDGGLIGGASLKAEDFVEIIKVAE